MIACDTGLTLKEFVAEAERVFGGCGRVAQNPNGVDFPSLYLHRHMIFMADGVEILCAAPNVVATIPLMRSMLEALIALIYIHKEFRKHKKKGRPRWYSMFNGVNCLYDMAKEVKLAALYRMQYGPSSGIVHARDPDAFLYLQDDGSAEFKDLRDSRGLRKAREDACKLLLMGTRVMIMKFLASQDRQRDQGKA